VLIISDTNILSSLAAAEALPLLFRLFPNNVIYIPPAVQQELQVGLERGQAYLQMILDAVSGGQLQVLPLSDREQHLAGQLPRTLNLGEQEAIALTQSHQARLLSNDKRAVRYCQTYQLKVVDLADVLRLLWTRRVVTRANVEQIITRMQQVENLVLNQTDRDKIFAPIPRRRRRRKS
jgi:predicted nucleic acid-binding protein